MPSSPLLQSELPLSSVKSEVIREWLREHRKTPLRRLGDWFSTTLLHPALRGLLVVIKTAEPLRGVPAPLWTVASMLLSIAVYSSRMGWRPAAGFITLLMIHECGHLFAARYYGIRVSVPVFIPYIGAIIDMREPMRNAWEEAVFGISGPVLGSLGAFASLGLHHFTGNFYFAELAFFGFFLNLFNLIPLGFLDGGHVAAAISRWLWIPGYIMMAAFVWFVHAPAAILMLVVMLPMVLSLFRRKPRKNLVPQSQDYDHVSLGKRVTIALLYLGLVVILVASMGWVWCKDISPALHTEKSLTHSSPGNQRSDGKNERP
jgi:Zn-dependent protease